MSAISDFMRAVDGEFLRLTLLWKSEDFRDYDYAGAHADGCDPIETAHSALALDPIGREFLVINGVDVRELEV